VNIPDLAEMGPRISIFGPSNAGKSSLAVALGQRLGIAHIHLDLLYHTPNTDWVPRSPAEFDRLHAAAIADDRWIMEGNYMRLLTERIGRTTGIILLGTDRWSALRRYVTRTLFDRRRLGIHEGTRDRLNAEMVRFIMVEQPGKRQRDIALLRDTGLPMVQLENMRQLKTLYSAWSLDLGL